jgi:NADH dehydrogenase
MQKKKVIVVGGGFAGIHLTRKLDERLFDVLLIDKLNHHQFQPLFYQVATSQIEPSSISFPLRNIFKSKENVSIRIGELQKVDKENNRIITDIGVYEYDYLAIAIGCTTNFFGNKNIGNKAYTLKSTYDAITIRNHILQTFERIITAPEEEKESLLNLVIVGAGPTGVELSGAFAEIKKNILPKDYHDIDFSRFNIILAEGSSHTLANMSLMAQSASRRYLENMGVTIMTETFVKDYDGKVLTFSSGEQIKTGTVIWAAGVVANEVQGFDADMYAPGKRLKVDRFNKVLGCGNIYALGDIACMETPKYPKGHPQVANVAIRQAGRLAKNLKLIEKLKQPVPYEYVNFGTMATIGTNKAVVDFPFVKFRGYFAWYVWMFLHLMLILSVRNKVIIFLNWAWAYFTKDTSLRLILTQNKD